MWFWVAFCGTSRSKIIPFQVHSKAGAGFPSGTQVSICSIPSIHVWLPGQPDSSNLGLSAKQSPPRRPTQYALFPSHLHAQLPLPTPPKCCSLHLTAFFLRGRLFVSYLSQLLLPSLWKRSLRCSLGYVYRFRLNGNTILSREPHLASQWRRS